MAKIGKEIDLSTLKDIPVGWYATVSLGYKEIEDPLTGTRTTQLMQLWHSTEGKSEWRPIEFIED